MRRDGLPSRTLLRGPLVPPDRIPVFDKWVFVLFVVLLPVALGSAREIFDDGDVSWHIATGHWILAHGRVPTRDPFSFTMAGEPWVAHEWLADILYGLFFELAGYAGVSALAIIAIAILHLIVFLHLRRRVGPIAVAASLAALDLVLLPFTLARPHLLVWPLLAAWTAMLLSCRDNHRSPPVAGAAIMLVWTNLHGSFPLGLVILAAIGFDALVRTKWQPRAVKAWLAFGLASVGASLINWSGLPGLLHPFSVATMQTLPLIEEWQPSDLGKTPWFFVVLVLVAGALLVSRPTVRLGSLSLLLLLLAMALAQTRHQGWLAIVGVLILPPSMFPQRGGAVPPPFGSPQARRTWLATGSAAVLVLASVRSLIVIDPVNNISNPRKLIAAVPHSLRQAPVFNGYSFGGPLILAGIRPYVDGRSDMYGDGFMTDYRRIVTGDVVRFEKAVRDYGIVWTMLPHGNRKLLAVLDSSPEWQRLVADDVGVIHVRIAAAKAAQAKLMEPRPHTVFTQRQVSQ